MSPIIVELESINAELNTAGKALKTSKKEIKENFPSMDQMEVKLKGRVHRLESESYMIDLVSGNDRKQIFF